MKDSNELLLIQQAIRGNQQAFEQLFNSYSPSIYNFINKLVKNNEEADDILQETFLRAWKYRKKFSLEKDFSRWLYQIAHNCCRKFFRPKFIRFFTFSELTLDGEDSPVILERLSDRQKLTPEQELAEKDTLEKIRKMIQALPKKFRAVIILRYQENMSYEEISEITSIPLGTVKTYLFRAHKILQKKLKQNHRDRDI